MQACFAGLRASALPSRAPALAPATLGHCARAGRGGADMGAKQSGPAHPRVLGLGFTFPAAAAEGQQDRGRRGAAAAAGRRFPAQVPSAHQPSASGGAAAASAAPRSRSLGGPWGPWRRGPGRRSQPSASPTAAAARTARRTRFIAARRTAAAAAARDNQRSRGHRGPRLVIGSPPAHLSPHMFGGTALSLCLP